MFGRAEKFSGGGEGVSEKFSGGLRKFRGVRIFLLGGLRNFRWEGGVKKFSGGGLRNFQEGVKNVRWVEKIQGG